MRFMWLCIVPLIASCGSGPLYRTAIDEQSGTEKEVYMLSYYTK